MDRLTQQQQKILMSTLGVGRVKTRKQGNQEVSYLEAWDIRATLIRLFGFGGFDAEVIDSGIVHMEQVDVAYRQENGGRNAPLEYKIIKYVDPSTGEQESKRAKHWVVTAHATLRLRVRFADGQTATYTEVAIASQKGPDLGEVADFAQKTAESDALKRAAVNLGTQFGMSLYDKGSRADVVRYVYAPGQEWAEGKSLREGGEVAAEPTEEQAALEASAQAEYPGAARTPEEAEAQLARANLGRRQAPEEPSGNYNYQGDTADPT